MKAISQVVGCDAAMELMSPFIDSMVNAEEAERLRAHVSECSPCARQLQAFISLRNLVARVEPVPVPEDLQLDTRLRLSRERRPNDRNRWQARVDNILKPLAVPAVMGVALSLMGIVVLFGSLVAPREVQATPNVGGPLVATYEPPRTTTPTLKRFSRTMSPDLEQALSIQTEVNNKGLVVDYIIIGGSRSAHIDQWLQEMLLLAQFRPATSWGNPVPSRVILSFVNVRG
jgi:anti-sigma factor (TIGR02949 family)